MTLVAAWVRQLKGGQELYVASDSRISGGRTWDIAIKILDLGRGDAVIAFAGHTDNAYPLMLQLQSAVKMHPKMSSRACDITELKGRMLNLFNDMWKRIYNLPRSQCKPDPAEVSFILAGRSWRHDDFRIWKLEFDDHAGIFKFASARSSGDGDKGMCFAFIGDHHEAAADSVVKLAMTKDDPILEMEPLRVLVDFIRDKTKMAIGGVPHVVKIYKHLNVLPYNVHWSGGEGPGIAFGGRMLMDGERNNFLVIDPDTFQVTRPQWPVNLRAEEGDGQVEDEVVLGGAV